MAASVTGAGLALPLLTAGGAQAADTATWDRVALCESGGIWSANSGNGFYGGLQLTLEMWKDYGGESYAERPDLASRSQQIAVAESILNDRGPDAWPSCSVNAGLDLDGLIPDVDPGSTQTPAPEPTQPSDGATDGETGGILDGVTDEPSATPSGDADSGEAQPSEGATEGATEDPAESPSGDSAESPSGDSSEQPTADPSDSPTEPSGSAQPSEGATESPAPSDGGTSAPGTGRHRGGADDGKGDGKDGRPEGRHASRGGDAHRGTGEGDGVYTVRPGDNLSAIAAEYGLAEGWTGLYDANEGVIGADPDLIKPGQRLDLGQ
ncbi:transglycosylase family protein [Streptomyces purpurogeneiscleroticus]|uniref:transglycosylase family protein n=1 Tax=Streptomyces purpurogeneiscleroticus TaxID=68259 RepID=UPI0027E02C5B|nr:transglycosylase family protein [Streptomyces purpurogeneiscleroticus]